MYGTKSKTNQREVNDKIFDTSSSRVTSLKIFFSLSVKCAFLHMKLLRNRSDWVKGMLFPGYGYSDT